VKRRIITSARDRSNTRYDSLLSRIDQFETFAPIISSLLQGGQQNNGETAEIPVDFENSEGQESEGSFDNEGGSQFGGNEDGFGNTESGNSFNNGGFQPSQNGFGNTQPVNSFNNGGFQPSQNGFGNTYQTGSGAANPSSNGGFVPSPVDPFANSGQTVQSPEIVYGTPNTALQVPDTVYGPPGYVPPPVVGNNYDITENEIRSGAANSLSLPSSNGVRFSPNQIQTQNRIPSQSTGSVIQNRPVSNRNGVRTSSTGTRGSTRNGGSNGGPSADLSDALGTLTQIPVRAINVYRTRTNTAYNRLESMINQFSRLLPTLLQGSLSSTNSRSGSNGSRRSGSTPASSSGDLEFSSDVSRK
jgi:hypothetical protein